MTARICVAFVGSLAVAGCSSAAANDGPPAFPLAASWHYVAEQRLPSIAHLEGDIQVTHQSGLRFDGSIDVFLTDASGRADRRTGLLAGRTLDATNVDFDARLDDSDVRRHLGHLSGDTISGEWAQSTGTLVASGTFRMVRR